MSWGRQIRHKEPRQVKWSEVHDKYIPLWTSHPLKNNTSYFGVCGLCRKGPEALNLSFENTVLLDLCLLPQWYCRSPLTNHWSLFHYWSWPLVWSLARQKLSIAWTSVGDVYFLQYSCIHHRPSSKKGWSTVGRIEEGKEVFDSESVARKIFCCWLWLVLRTEREDTMPK